MMGTKGLPYSYPASARAYKELFDQGAYFTPYEGASGHLEGGFGIPKIDCSKSKDKDCEYEVGEPIGCDMLYTLNGEVGRF